VAATRLGLTSVNQRPAVAFGATLDSSYDWSFIATEPTIPDSIVLYYIMASATSGTVQFSAAVEAITDADATDLDAVEGFDTQNLAALTTVKGTAGYLGKVRIALNNDDSMTAGDQVRIRVTRHAMLDSATGNALLLAVEVCG